MNDTRLIDADELPITTEFSDDGEYSWDIVPAFRIREAPTIDAVPVVRCKECKHFGFAHDCNCHAADENGTPIFVREDDFCSYGERRGDG